MKNRTRNHTPSDAGLQKRLTSYMTAAGAVGAAGMAFAPGAEAAIVYSNPVDIVYAPTNNVNPIGWHSLDLNGDLVDDLNFANYTGWSYLTWGSGIVNSRAINTYYFSPQTWNPTYSYGTATKLSLGNPIGSGGPFPDNTYHDADFSLWAGQGDGYLGLKFDISGQTHYGWIRMNVDTVANGRTMTIMDWAYDSTADTPILAGDGIPAAVPEPGTLGMMALGAVGLMAHRKARKAA